MPLKHIACMRPRTMQYYRLNVRSHRMRSITWRCGVLRHIAVFCHATCRAAQHNATRYSRCERTLKHNLQWSILHIEQSVAYMCLCVRTTTFELRSLWPRYLACWFILTLARLHSKVKVIGQSSRSPEEATATARNSVVHSVNVYTAGVVWRMRFKKKKQKMWFY